MSDLVTIVIPTFNPGTQLERALESIARQTYQQIETLVIDGQSTDNTPQIIERYKHVVSRWVCEPDNGIYDAMNKGLRLASGVWIYFLGADDALYAPTALAELLTPERAASSDVIYGDAYNEAKALWWYSGLLTERRLVSDPFCHQAIVMRTALARKLGGFDPKYRMSADRVLNMKWFGDSQVRRTYVNHPVSYYGGDGASAHTPDPAYERDELMLVFRHLSFPTFLKTLRAWISMRTPARLLQVWRLVRSPFYRRSVS